MAFLTGPHAPIQSALVQLSRSERDEPFGVFEGVMGGGLTPIECAILQLVGTMNRLMGLIETVVKPKPIIEYEDDFMRGWGEPGGPMEP